jgi:putative oxidoreductase
VPLRGLAKSRTYARPCRDRGTGRGLAVGKPAVAHLRAGRHVAVATRMDLGLVILRTVVGAIIAAHGAQKLFGWFRGSGIADTGAFFEALGFRPGSVMASMAGVAELIGGASLALGLLTPFAAALVLAVMIVAIASAHAGKGLFTENGGYEYPLTIAAVATALAFSGPGAFSLDRLAGLSFAGAKWGLVAIALAVAGALPPLLGRATDE